MSTATANLPKKDHEMFRDLVKLYEDKHYKRGMKLADQLLLRQPNHGETMAMKALILVSLNRKKEAFDVARLAIRNDIRSYVCWHVFGTVHKSDGNHREACKSFINALKIDPDNNQVMRDLASSQVHIGDYSGLVETRRLLLVQKPSFAINWAGFAVAHYLNHSFVDAAAVIDNYLSNQSRQQELSDSEFSVFKLKCLRKIYDNSALADKEIALSEFNKAVVSSSSSITDKMMIDDLSRFSNDSNQDEEEEEEVLRSIESGNVFALFNSDDDVISPIFDRLTSSRSDYWSRIVKCKLLINAKSSLALDATLDLIKETPTNLDLYILLSDCFWRCCGDGISAVSVADFAASLDSADRYLNSIQVMKRLETAKSHQEIDLALDIASKFVFERHSSIHHYMVDLQASWLELRLGAAYLNIGDYEHSYPYYQLVHKYYDSLFAEELFDFHHYVYSRRGSIGMSAYVDLIESKQKILHHPNHTNALIGLLFCLTRISIQPQKVKTEEEQVNSDVTDKDDDADDDVVVEDLSKKMESLGGKSTTPSAASSAILPVNLPQVPDNVQNEASIIFDKLFASYGLSLVNGDVQVNASMLLSVELMVVLIQLFPKSSQVAAIIQPHLSQLPNIYQTYYQAAELSLDELNITDRFQVDFLLNHIMTDANKNELLASLAAKWPYGQRWSEANYYQSHDNEMF